MPAAGRVAAVLRCCGAECWAAAGTYLSKCIDVNGTRVNLKIWDTVRPCLPYRCISDAPFSFVLSLSETLDGPATVSPGAADERLIAQR